MQVPVELFACEEHRVEYLVEEFRQRLSVLGPTEVSVAVTVSPSCFTTTGMSPTTVEKWNVPLPYRRPSATAEAMVAWPQKSISTPGLK